MKPYKLKDYSKKHYSTGKKRSPLRMLLGVVVLAGLVFLGASIYPVVAAYIKHPVSIATSFDQSSIVESPMPETPPSAAADNSLSSTVEEQSKSASKTTVVHAVVLPLATAQNKTQLERFVAELPKEINTVYVQVKNPQGLVLYNTQTEQAKRWETVSPTALDITALADYLHKQNLQLMAGVAVFSDPLAARADLNNAVMHSSGVIWIDNLLDLGGKPWTTPYSEAVVKYHAALVRELTTAGADRIVLEYMQFPYDPTASAVFAKNSTQNRQQVLTAFMEQMKQAAGDRPIGLWLTAQQAQNLESPQNVDFFGGNPIMLAPAFFVAQQPEDNPTVLGSSQKTVSVVAYFPKAPKQTPTGEYLYPLL